MSKEIKKQLKELRNIAPDKAWKRRQRDILMAQIKNSAPAETVQGKFTKKVRAALDVFVPYNQIMKIARPVAAFVFVMSVAMGGGIATVGASMNSIPGDALYTVKRTTEKVRLILTPDEIEKARLQLKFADARMEEVNRLSKQKDYKKSDKIKETVESLKAEVETVHDSINKAIESAGQQDISDEDSDEDSKELVDMAMEIDSRKEEFENALNETKENLATGEDMDDQGGTKEDSEKDISEVSQSLDQAIESINTAVFDVLRIIAYKEHTEKVKIDDREITERLSVEFNKIKKDADHLYNELKFLAGQEDLEKINYALLDSDLQALKNKLDETFFAIDTIAGELENKNFEQVYNNIKFHREAVIELKEKIAALES